MPYDRDGNWIDAPLNEHSTTADFQRAQQERTDQDWQYAEAAQRQGPRIDTGNARLGGEPSYAEGPQIYNGPVRNDRPLPESAFRAFEPGGDAGTLDPNVTGMALPDEVMIRHTEEQLNSMQLSQSERLRLQRLQNAQSRVQEQLASGHLAPMEAQALSQQIGGQMQPLMIRQSQLPAYMRLLQFQQARQQMARQTALDLENRRVRAMTASERLHTVEDENGQMVRFMEQPNGTLIRVTEPREQQQQRPPITVAQRNAIINRMATEVDRDIDDGSVARTARAEEIRRRTQERMEELGIDDGQNSTQPTAQPTAQPVAQPQAQGQPQAAQQPQQEQRPPEIVGIDAIRTVVARHPNPAFRNDRNTMDRLNEVQRLIEQHGPVAQMPADARRQYDELAAMIQRALRNFSLEGRQQAQPAASSGPGFGDIPWGQYGVP